MEVGIRVLAKDIIQKPRRHVITCYFTMVAVDDQGQPTPIPPRVIETLLEQRRYQAGALRCEIERRTLEIKRWHRWEANQGGA